MSVVYSLVLSVVYSLVLSVVCLARFECGFSYGESGVSNGASASNEDFADFDAFDIFECKKYTRNEWSGKTTLETSENVKTTLETSEAAKLHSKRVKL